MKKWISVAVLACCFLAPTFGQTFSKAQMQADLDHFRSKMTRLYPGFGQYILEKDWLALCQKTADELPDSLEYQAFYQRLRPLAFALEDGHFGLSHRKNMMKKTVKTPPFVARKVGEKWYVALDVSRDSLLPRGTEILKMDKKPVDDWRKQIFENYHMASDGKNETGRNYLSQPGLHYYLTDWRGETDSVDLVFRKPDSSKIEQKRLANVPMNERGGIISKRYSKEIVKHKNLEVTLVDSVASTAILHLTTFSGFKKWDIFQFIFQRKLRRAFKKIDHENIKNLVIDLRSNGGGDVGNSARVLRFLVNEPFNVFDSTKLERRAIWAWVIPKWNPLAVPFFFASHKKDASTSGWKSRGNPSKKGQKPRKRHHFDGNLYFLMNGITYSASVSVMAHCLSQQRATFVGEAAGGAYWGDFAARFKKTKLPNSKIQLSIPLKKLFHGIDPARANGFCIEPDFAVERTENDIRTGRDIFLPVVFELIRKGKKVRG